MVGVHFLWLTCLGSLNHSLSHHFLNCSTLKVTWKECNFSTNFHDVNTRFFNLSIRHMIANQVFVIQKEYCQITRVVVISFILNTYSFPYFQNSCCQLYYVVSARSEFRQFCIYFLLVQNKRTQEQKKQTNTKKQTKNYHTRKFPMI